MKHTLRNIFLNETYLKMLDITHIKKNTFEWSFRLCFYFSNRIKKHLCIIRIQQL